MKTRPIVTEKAPSAVGPYSQGIKTDKFIYTSGQLPIDRESGRLLTGNIKKETRLCLEHVLAVVEAGGATLEDIAKVNVYVTDMEDFPTINEEYEVFFKGHKPARALVEVAKLPGGADIEIEAVAVL